MRRRILSTGLATVAFAGLLSAAVSMAQTPAAAPSPDVQNSKVYNAKVDWPWLAKFKEADLALAPPAEGENRVVFHGRLDYRGLAFQTGRQGSFPASPTLTAASAGRPRRRCWCASVRM